MSGTETHVLEEGRGRHRSFGCVAVTVTGIVAWLLVVAATAYVWRLIA